MTSNPVSVVNTAPAATVALSPASPGTAATVTATATKTDADLDPVSLTFVWKVNGATVRTFSSPSALVDTLDLSVAGNGDPGDVVSVEVTPTDGTGPGTTVAAQLTVAAAGPTTLRRRRLHPDRGQQLGQRHDRWRLDPVGHRRRLRRDRRRGHDRDDRRAAPTARPSSPRSRSPMSISASGWQRARPRVAATSTSTAPSGRVPPANFYRATLRIATSGKVYVGASSVINNAETGIGSEVLVAGLGPHPGCLHLAARPAQRHQPDDHPGPGLGRRRHRADHLAVHRHQLGGLTPGGRRGRPPGLPGLGHHQRPGHRQLRRLCGAEYGRSASASASHQHRSGHRLGHHQPVESNHRPDLLPRLWPATTPRAAR